MSIYRAYDIRGVFGIDLTAEVAFDVGRAFATYLGGGTVSVGMDNRLSSQKLKDSLIKGLISSGLNVIDVGLVPSPLLYFSIHKFSADGGIMITGSHNPPEYNGFKMCRGTDALYGEQIQELKGIIGSKNFRKGNGKLKKEDVIGDYINYVGERISPGKKIKVVIDAGNGTASVLAERLFSSLGCDVIPLYCESDGNFPNHHPDPSEDGNLQDLVEKVKTENADLGIAFDGDADRAGFVDDNGKIIRGDEALILFSKDILRDKKAKIIFEVKCSQALIDEIESNGGIPIMYRTGHSFIKKKMRKEKALLAGEMSGHFYFADNYYGYDDGLFAGARMVQILSNTDDNFSKLIALLPKYHSTPEIRVECPDDRKFKIVEEVTKELQKEYEVITVDGARVQFGDGWGLVRASNTQPALILRFEAKTEGRLKEIETIIKDELRTYPELAGHI